MLLRSSSTPVLGSLLSSLSETPNNNNQPNCEVPNANPHPYGKICCKHYHAAAGPQNFTKSLYNSSPVSPSISGNIHTGGFRRAQSEGNLEGLVRASSDSDDGLNLSIPTKKFSRRPPHCSILEAIPSFSFQNPRNRNEDQGSEEEEESLHGENGLVHNSVAKENPYNLKGDRTYASAYKNSAGVGEEMHLARGLGVTDFHFADVGGHIRGGSGGGGRDYRPVALGGDGGGDSNGLIMEEHYKRMLEENPSNPLCLRNYAQFLHQTKKDPRRAEEYYSRAILADPEDGEVLSNYAKLVWELYRDKDRAKHYFERAVRAAAQDSHVQAAYASFLWETDEEVEEEDDRSLKTPQPMLALIKEEITA
ncbi:unnamed protein product [Coffea canephora]|uniref:TmcB/TmcC TPR repeats domain-containing protein n=1 Tax=Coffea canephora TaxID=49390 RepID=A0A068U5G9_COFCA|nr:unnamed protein product [Coffea canephora]